MPRDIGARLEQHEASVMDIIFYSGTLTGGRREEGCYRGVDASADVYQEKELINALRVGTLKVRAQANCGGYRALSNDCLRTEPVWPRCSSASPWRISEVRIVGPALAQ